MERLFTTNTEMSMWKLVQLGIEIPLCSDIGEVMVNHTWPLSSRILCFYHVRQ